MQVLAFWTRLQAALDALVPGWGGHTAGSVLDRPNSFHAPYSAVSRWQHLSVVITLGLFTNTVWMAELL